MQVEPPPLAFGIDAAEGGGGAGDRRVVDPAEQAVGLGPGILGSGRGNDHMQAEAQVQRAAVAAASQEQVGDLLGDRRQRLAQVR